MNHLPIHKYPEYSYLPAYKVLYKYRGLSITVEESLQIALFFCKTNPNSEKVK